MTYKKPKNRLNVNIEEEYIIKLREICKLNKISLSQLSSEMIKSVVDIY